MTILLRWVHSFLHRARAALDVIRNGPRSVDRETDKAVAQFISGQRKPGLPCPECGTPIIVTVADLLARDGVECGKCALKLSMDWQADPQARRALENLQRAALNVESARRPA